MTIPNYGDKYDAEALFSPAEAVEAQGDGLPEAPPAMLLGYQPRLTEAVRERAGDPVTLVRSQHFYRLAEDVGYVPVHEWGIGASITATVAENAIAAGSEAVVMLGGGAALQREFHPDDPLLPTRAVRDEGVSHHYHPPDEELTPTPALLDALDASLTEAGFDTHRGPTWTTSAFYRETIPEIEHYRDEGFVSLCMETAALWAVCRYRGAATATVHEIGDYLDPEGWEPRANATSELPALLEPTVAGLERYL